MSDFQGFTAPQYTQVPNEFFDVLLRDLSGAETKVLCCIFRRTFGWHKEQDRISLDQIAVDAGLSKRAAQSAVLGLEAHQAIEVIRHRKGQSYRVHFAGQTDAKIAPIPEATDAKIAPIVSRTVAESATTSWQKLPPQKKETKSSIPGSKEPDETNADLDAIWQEASVRLAATMTPANWQTWLADARLIALERTEEPCAATIAVPTEFQQSWLEKRFVGLVEKVLRELLGRAVLVRFVVQTLVLSG